jgi:hypothetical protein
MARSLASKQNVTAPGGDYPYGRIKNNSGGNNGTPVNEEVYGDVHQFFERLMAIAGTAFNGQPDNNGNGFQLFVALQTVIQSYITALKGGVSTSGDTLLKLYNLITAMGRPRGGWDASSNTVPGSASNEAGDFWRITVAGTLSSLASGGGAVKAGDVLIAISDGATAQSDFYCIQSNVDQATSSVLGLVKLYTDLAASNTDGTATQSAIKTALDNKFVAGTVVADNTTVEIDSVNPGTLRVRDGGISDAKLETARVKSIGVQLLTKQINIGDWNMNFSVAGSASVLIAHGIADYKKIRSVTAIVRSDDDATYRSFPYYSSTGSFGGVGAITSTDVTLVLTSPNTAFDNVSYDSTSFNRGWIIVTYEA